MLANKMMEEKLLHQSKPSLTEEKDLCATKNQPHQVSSDRALSKAFKMAYDLMTKKRTELKEKPRRKDNIEKQQILMKKATARVVKVLKSYREDVSSQSNVLPAWLSMTLSDNYSFLLSLHSLRKILQRREKTRVR